MQLHRLKLDRGDLFFAVLVALAVLKAALSRYFALGDVGLMSTLLLETAFIVTMLALVDLAPPRRSYLATLGAYSVLSLLLMALTVWVAFYTQLFDPRILAMAGQLATVGGAVGGLIKPTYVLFLVDIPFLAWWAVVLGRADRAAADAGVVLAVEAESEESLPAPTRASGRSLGVAVALIACMAVFVVQAVLALQISSEVDGVAVARERGLIVAQVAALLSRDEEAMARTVEGGPPLEAIMADVATSAPDATAGMTLVAETPGSMMQERIDLVRAAENGSRVATFAPGAYAGKNVILVQVEALNTMVMQRKIKGREITPNLNAIINESWYFPNTYAETGLGNTADAEFIVNTSLLPPKTQAAPVAYVDRVLPSLPRLLGDQGYRTFTAHANRISYWNRKELYAALGFSQYYERAYFGSKDMFNENGASDEVLFKKSGELLRQADATTTPFYAQIITLSAHNPFDLIPQARRPLKTPSDLEGSLMGDYISSESYSDLAVGKFVKQLKADGIWDDSIVVFYGDHTSMTENTLAGTSGLAAKRLLGRPYSAADRQRVPLIIHLPGQMQSQVVTATAGQIDIMPTIADLVGIDLQGTPHLGRSLFVASGALVPMRSYLPGGSFANDRVVFLPGVGYKDGKAFGVESGVRAEKTERENADLERVRQLSKLSEEWVMSQPKRSDARKLVRMRIPNLAARAAARVMMEKKGAGK